MDEKNETDPRDRKRFYFVMTPFRVVFTATLSFVFRFLMKMEIFGLENLPLDGGVILAANHVTNFDVFPIQLSLPRPLFFMAKSGLFKNPIMDVALRHLGAFPVFRGEKDHWATRHAAKVLEHSQVLAMFPEGTRSKSRGLGVAKTGTARLAIEKGAPIVPMAVTGTDQFFKRFPHRARVTISLLPPLLPHPGETPLALTDRLMFTLAASLPEEMRGVYAEVPDGFRDEVQDVRN